MIAKYIPSYWLNLALLSMVALSLNACGFQLRGSAAIPERLTQIQLESNSGSVEFERALRIALTRAGVNVLEDANTLGTTDYLTLKVNPLSNQDSVLAVASNNDVTELQRRLSGVYFLLEADGKALYGPRTVGVTRILSNQNAEESTKAAYNSSMMQTMAELLAQQLVYDLAYVPL